MARDRELERTRKEVEGYVQRVRALEGREKDLQRQVERVQKEGEEMKESHVNQVRQRRGGGGERLTSPSPLSPAASPAGDTLHAAGLLRAAGGRPAQDCAAALRAAAAAAGGAVPLPRPGGLPLSGAGCREEDDGELGAAVDSGQSRVCQVPGTGEAVPPPFPLSLLHSLSHT